MDAVPDQRAFEAAGSESAGGNPVAEAARIAADRIVQQGRQDYLDALPIAAAVLQRGAAGWSWIDLANPRFAEIGRAHV